MTTAIARKHNGETVDYLRDCLMSSEHGISGLTTAIKVAVKERAWERRIEPRTGQEYRCDSFVELITEPPLKGLGWTIEGLKKLCRDDTDVLDIIDRETQRPGGKPITVDNVHAYNGERPSGNSADRALRKLRKDAPALHARVIAGELSPHAAMVEAGFRRKTATVPVDDPDRVSAFLAKYFCVDDIKKIAELAIFLKESD